MPVKNSWICELLLLTLAHFFRLIITWSWIFWIITFVCSYRYHHLKLYPEDESGPQNTKKPVVIESYNEVVFPEPSEAFLARVQNHPAVVVPSLPTGLNLPSPGTLLSAIFRLLFLLLWLWLLHFPFQKLFFIIPCVGFCSTGWTYEWQGERWHQRSSTEPLVPEFLRGWWALKTSGRPPTGSGCFVLSRSFYLNKLFYY